MHSATTQGIGRKALGSIPSNCGSPIGTSKDLAKAPSHCKTTDSISIKKSSSSENRFKFSLISPKEFTILSYGWGGMLTSDNSLLEKFLPRIKKIASPHGGMTIESPGAVDIDDDDELLAGNSRWRIPLACYDEVSVFFQRVLSVDSVDGIPEAHLKASQLHWQNSQEGYPEPKELIEIGVPPHLAEKLTPYQREGVMFVHSREGKAFIADEMGLGKTIQSIAAMAAFVSDWPLLVLSPSSARFNWKAESLAWLGKSPDHANHDALIDEKDVQVLEAGKERIRKDAKIVICSYGLLTTLVGKKRITEGSFKSIIVDESHCLKSIKAQRTKAALPLLKGAERVILLSGTPAFKNPQELFPQLTCLSQYFADEKEFKEAYCYKSSTSVGGKALLTLHALMSSTVMIRRRKADVLSDVLPAKIRELSHVTVTNETARQHLNILMDKLRETKGSLGKVARALEHTDAYETFVDSCGNKETDELEEGLKELAIEGNEEEFQNMISFLPKLFELTGRVKVPVVVSQIKAWLNENDGKIIIFAHHRTVLDKIEEAISTVKRIRIDGATNPRKRQGYVQAFQNDPSVRVAVLSTTAAGVALTLTASSVVWFAEMFWTPGLLIQAEDRAHRIGQKNDVQVKYFVAKDTLDDVLWRLAVRKFIAVGEMVDGCSDTIDVQDYDEALLLDVSLELASFFDDNDSSLLEDFIVDDDAEGWGTAAKSIVDISPSKSVDFAPIDDSESECSFCSDDLTDDDDIKDEDDDSDESSFDSFLS